MDISPRLLLVSTIIALLFGLSLCMFIFYVSILGKKNRNVSYSNINTNKAPSKLFHKSNKHENPSGLHAGGLSAPIEGKNSMAPQFRNNNSDRIEHQKKLHAYPAVKEGKRGSTNFNKLEKVPPTDLEDEKIIKFIDGLPGTKEFDNTFKATKKQNKKAENINRLVHLYINLCDHEKEHCTDNLLKKGTEKEKIENLKNGPIIINSNHPKRKRSDMVGVTAPVPAINRYTSKLAKNMKKVKKENKQDGKHNPADLSITTAHLKNNKINKNPDASKNKFSSNPKNKKKFSFNRVVKQFIRGLRNKFRKLRKNKKTIKSNLIEGECSSLIEINDFEEIEKTNVSHSETACDTGCDSNSFLDINISDVSENNFSYMPDFEFDEMEDDYFPPIFTSSIFSSGLLESQWRTTNINKNNYKNHNKKNKNKDPATKKLEDMRDKQNSRAPEKLDKSKEIKNKGKTESSNKNRKSNIVKSQDIKSTDGIAEVQKSLPPGFPEIVSVRLATEEDIRKHHSMRKVSKKAVL